MQPNLVEFINKHASSISNTDAEQIIQILEAKLGIGSGASGGESGESVSAQLLRESHQEKVTIFDVGANKGQYCAMICKELDGALDFEIHSFEPSKVAFEELSKTLGERTNVTLNNFGLSHESGEATLYMDRAASGLASLTARRLTHFGIDHAKLQETVTLRTLDDYCREKKIDRIHLLKIDVEGHELDVLRGGKTLLDAGKIGLIQFEFGGCNIDTRTFFQDYFYFFANAGYSLYRLLPDRSLLKIDRYRESDERFRTTNYLAAPNR